MRVLLLTQYVHPESFPINALLVPLRDAGVELTVLTGQPNYPEGVVFDGYRGASVRRDVVHEGIEVFRVPTIARGQGSAIRLLLNYLFFVLAASTIGPWLLRGRQFDVVFVYAPSPITQSIAGAVVARLKGARLVTWVQDLWPQSLEATGFVRNPRLLQWATRSVAWIYRRHDLILGQSNAFVEAIRSMAGDVPVAYLPNPGERPPDGEGEGAVLDLKQGFNVVFAGNLGTVQALDTIVEAATLLRDDEGVRFILVGSGSRADWVRQEVERLGLQNVELPGRFPRETMPGIFRQADALLVTLSRSPILAQTIPSKVQGYLAAGRPVLASLDGEGARLVEEIGAGLASPAEDGRALARNVRLLRAMPAQARTEMGARGQQAFDRDFRPDAVARLLRSILDELIAPRGGRPLILSNE